MCGIVGLVGDISSESGTLQAMSNAVAHRGPDDSGIALWPDHHVGLAHRRLSIIDLSPAGRNPMTNEVGTVWIVFNGEIYNFRALRRELEQSGHVFHTASDSEVVVHAYEQWGDDHVHRLRGMFAYAIYDRRVPRANHTAAFRLLLVRDRLGIKPLFYHWRAGLFAFASEIKAVLACNGIDRAIDWTALFDYLTYLYIPAPKTAYSQIRKLEPGHLLVFEDGRVDIRQYWDLGCGSTSETRTADEAVDLVRETLTEAVRLHMTSDVPVGALLSGGMDSSSVTALMAEATDTPILTFSQGFDLAGHSETQFARLVADRYRTRHHEETIGAESMERMLPRVLWMHDEPHADASVIPTHAISVAASRHVKVLLSGDGGDEIFAGYYWYRAWLDRRAIDVLPLGLRRRAFPLLERNWPPQWPGKRHLAELFQSPVGRYACLMELFSPEEKRRLLTPECARQFEGYDDYWHFRKHWRDELDPVTRLQYLDLKTYLPGDILAKVDRASMAASVEVRPPLLDHIVVERVFGIPSSWRLHARRNKWLLKQAMHDRLPAPVLSRPKKGFSAPMRAWMKARRKWAEAELRNGAGTGWLRPVTTIDPALFRRGTKVWSLLLLQQWLAHERRHQSAPTLRPSPSGDPGTMRVC